MTPEDRLAMLRGDWRTLRVIRPVKGPTVRFEGVTTWAPDAEGLRCEERGRMMQDGTAFEASRTTLWRAVPSGIAVSFADGRPFHLLDGETARHDCPPDTYVLRYDWSGRAGWTVRWRVTGPRKDYRALTRYRRA